MIRDIFTNKWIIGSVFLLLIIAAGCIWYYQHSTAADKLEVVKADKLLQKWKADKAKPAAETVSTKASMENLTSTAEKQRIKSIGEDAETNTDKPTESVSLPSIRTDSTEKPRFSPNGFGPYPKVPKDYLLTCGPTSWQMMDLFGGPPPTREIELIDRVMVKLWKDGDTRIQGGTFENGKVYVNYHDRVYVNYNTYIKHDGTTGRYISRWGSHSSVPIPTEAQMLAGDIPEGLEVIDLDIKDPGIEPYSFLDLDR